MTFGYCNGKHNGSYGHIWGDGNYTCDSSPCGAAVHIGAITNSGGFFKYRTVQY